MKKMNDVVANDATVTSSEVSNVKNSPDEKKKRKPIPPMWKILGKARKVFDAQLSKTIEVKLLCISNFVNAETQDKDKFWADYFEQVAELINSRRYLAECDRLKCDSVNLAEHIVFLGSATINKVLKGGVYATLGNDVRLYKDRLSPADADLYRNEVIA